MKRKRRISARLDKEFSSIAPKEKRREKAKDQDKSCSMTKLKTNTMIDDTFPNDESDILILKFQLDDIRQEKEQSKGKWNEDSPPDFFVALENFEWDIRNVVQCIEDSRIAQSIAQAVDSDAALLRDFALEERQARYDHDMALKLRGEFLKTFKSTKKIKYIHY